MNETVIITLSCVLAAAFLIMIFVLRRARRPYTDVRHSPRGNYRAPVQPNQSHPYDGGEEYHSYIPPQGVVGDGPTSGTNTAQAQPSQMVDLKGLLAGTAIGHAADHHVDVRASHATLLAIIKQMIGHHFPIQGNSGAGGFPAAAVPVGAASGAGVAGHNSAGTNHPN